MLESLRKLVVPILVWIIAIVALAASLFLTMSGFQNGNFPLGVFGIAMMLASLVAMANRFGTANRFDKPVRFMLTASFGLMLLAVTIMVIGVLGGLILLGFLLVLGVAVFRFIGRQNTLYNFLKVRLSRLGFEEKPDEATNGYIFTRDGIVIQEDLGNYRDGVSRIRCSAPNTAPLDKSFSSRARDEMYAAITAWLLENKIMDLEKEYQKLIQEEINSRR